MNVLRRFLTDSSGALSILFVILFPLLLLVGGAATDVSLLNAQKRYVQSQADLASLSAANHLPDPVEVRRIAREVVRKNDKYGTITLDDRDIRIGRYDTDTGEFVPAPNQVNPEFASAVQVGVPSPFKPILLSPVLSDEQIVIRKSAVGVQRAVVSFTLRNRLLSLHTDRAILGRVLGPLGLGLDAEVLGYMGLATTKISLNNLLGRIAGTDVGLDVLSFNDVLNLQVGRLDLLMHLVSLGGLADIDILPTAVGEGSLTLGQIVGASPTLLGLTAGDILPDIEVNVFDLLIAMAGLAADPDERLNVGLPVSLAPLADVNVSLGLIRPPVIATGYVDDTPPPTAHVSQVSLDIAATVLSLTPLTDVLSLALKVEIAAAEAFPLRLHCSASAPNDILAEFQASTAPVEIAVRLGVLSQSAPDESLDMDTVEVAGSVKRVAVTYGDFVNQRPVPVPNPLTLSDSVGSLADLLVELRDDLVRQSGTCQTGPWWSWLLDVVGCAVNTIVSGTLAAVTSLLIPILEGLGDVLENLTVLDGILQTVLDLLGIGVAQADIILDSYSCGTALAR